jgi:hypothetical protein
VFPLSHSIAQLLALNRPEADVLVDMVHRVIPAFFNHAELSQVSHAAVNNNTEES